MTTMTDNPQKLSPRVKSVAEAIAFAFREREDMTGKPSPHLIQVAERSTGKQGLMIAQDDDPDSALLLSDKGLGGVKPDSPTMPWTEDQDEAFFAALIVMLACEQQILEMPGCDECGSDPIEP